MTDQPPSPDVAPVSRRKFLRTMSRSSAAAAAVVGAAPSILRARSPNETVGVGHIGLGVRGGNVIYQVSGGRNSPPAEGAEVVAICDAYKPHREKGLARGKNPEARAYVDYHDLLADPRVDAVVIATPDHWHARMVLDAAAAGKDVYCEKGWTRSVAEAKAMHAAVKKSGIVMQLGHQGRSRTAGAQAAEMIASGVLGPVTVVRTGRMINGPVGQAIWRWYGEYRNFKRPDPRQVERDVDWKRWLGATPERPFDMERFWHWRCYWDYGTGIGGDLLSHEIDFVQAVLGHGIPDTCVSYGQNSLLKDGREVPDTWHSIFGFEEAGRTVTFDCSMNSREPTQPPEFRGKEAVLRFDSIAQSVQTFDVTVEGSSVKYGAGLRSGKITSEKPILSFDPARTPPLPNHMQDFINCVRSRKKPRCNEDQALIETATILMAVTAYHQKRQVRWDREKQEIV